MKCSNCGKKMKIGSEICSECGAEQKEKEIPISTAIATVLVIIFITCAVIGFYFAFGKEKLTESNMKRQLENNAGEAIIEMYFDDFNGDGVKEAFAVTGSGGRNAVLNGSLWFMEESRGVNIKSGFSGSINGLISENGKKYFSVEIKEDDGSTRSYIYGVNKFGEYTAAPASEKYSYVKQENGRILDEKGHEVSIEHPED